MKHCLIVLIAALFSLAACSTAKPAETVPAAASDSDVIVKAVAYYSNPNKGETFIGGVFPVE